MDDAVGSVPSCPGATDTRFDHARCAIQKLVDTHGDIVFALARFRANCNSCGSVTGIDCDACDTGTGAGCSSTMNSPDRFELLVPLLDDNLDDVRSWVDFSCGACTFDPSANPELDDTSGFTPIGGSLRGARRYFQGADPFYAATLAPIYGTVPGDPIRNDPLKDVFVGGAQCRPYIVISLTDGDETCEQFSGTTGAASALLSTPVDGQNYRIEVKPIGFGQTPCDTQIEGIAHAGGAADVGGQCEGFYAQNEADLSIAFNQIIQDSIKVEVCDQADNDCDLEVDEGFQLYCDVDGVLGAPEMLPILCTDPGDDCDGNDDNCFMGIADEPRNACGECGPEPPEICNGVDDDCDGGTDEGNVCDGCVPGPETCNGADDDCDGTTDEGLTRPCGFDFPPCTAGTETCVDGEFIGCDAVLPQPEVCDGVDNDCDGNVDGQVEECTVLPDPPGNPGVGECTPGLHICTDGSFGDCVGEVVPVDEICDLRDNDCDGTTDEDIPSVECGTTCGAGMTECVDGVIECIGGMTSEPEECNSFDDDCDGVVDEGLPSMGPCDEGGTLCTPGELLCVGGTYQCIGGDPPAPEICDCEDNDCDTQVDETDQCPAGSTCTACQCAFPCEDNEFPCPLGRICVDDFCLVDRCFDVTCEPDEDGNHTTCVDGECVETCGITDCVAPFVCRPSDGTCQPDNCSAFPDKCTVDEFCVAGECVDNPCVDVTCPDGEYCQGGECRVPCADVTCPAGQLCDLGECVDDPCADDPCTGSQICIEDTGECEQNPCLGRMCPVGQACNPQTGLCEQDRCLGVTCPSPEHVCVDGTCHDPDQVDRTPDAGPPPDHTFVGPGGGGGCSCNAASGSAPDGGWWLMLAGLALVAIRRRR